METPGFLEKLYGGIFDEKLFASCHAPLVSEKAKGILESYLSVLKKYNPVELEEMGNCLRNCGTELNHPACLH